MRLYIDEDSCDSRLVQELRRLGLEVLAANELRRTGLSDREHLEFAAAEGCAILTANIGDFHALHGEWAATGRTHHGILLWKKSVRRSPESLAASVFEVVGTAASDQYANAVVKVPNRND